MHVDNCLLELRAAAGLTQDDIAAAIGRNRATVSRMERGEAPIPDRDKPTIAKLLGCTVSRLMGWDEAAA